MDGDPLHPNSDTEDEPEPQPLVAPVPIVLPSSQEDRAVSVPSSQTDSEPPLGTSRLDHFMDGLQGPTRYHPERILRTVHTYLKATIPLPGTKRRRLGKINPYRSVLVDLDLDDCSGLDLGRILKRKARDLYRKLSASIARVTRRVFIKDYCKWGGSSEGVQQAWAVLVRACEDFRDVAAALEAATPDCHEPGDLDNYQTEPAGSSQDGCEPEDASVRGYGFLLTYNISAGEGVDEVMDLIRRGLPDEELCRLYGDLPCYKNKFRDAVRFATRLAQQLKLPLCNVGMEKSTNSEDLWRVHVHVLVSINPSGTSGLGRVFPVETQMSRFEWDGVKPNVQVIFPTRATAGVLAKNISNLSYYVVGPKIGQILKQATLWPITDRCSRRCAE